MAPTKTGPAHVRRGRDVRTWCRVLALAVPIVLVSACQKDATPEPFIGPSELGLSLALTASPDVLPLDGASQALVTILARDGAGQAIPNVSLRLQMRFGGVLQDVGLLSARTLVTGLDGRALATYTAPLGGSVDGAGVIEILVTPVGEDYASAVSRTLQIRLVPTGLVVPPASFSAGFRFTPTSPVEFQEMLFTTNCLSALDLDCVNDPAGQIVSYAWDFGDGATASGLSATHAYAAPGTFTVRLTVTDAFGRSTSSARSVVVLTGSGPTATFAVSPTAPTLEDTVFFNASDSRASAGRSVVSYEWTFGDGDTDSGVTVSHVYEVATTYSVTLTVTDDRGASDSTSSSVAVISAAPTATFVFSPTAPTTNTNVRFNAVGSTATSGRTLVSFVWDFGDGNIKSGVTETHTFAVAGEYNVTLTVTDSAGVTATFSRAVTVS